ncbi:MFS transporter [Acidihalobacter prosperus]|uniref:Major facilitator superfamily (MFS) profile domain-containing protein n=1 Tax=Acidihalobacter prosperus TaxID=160660 RepID=A0A1A6C259_9GAMM|nr:MFS transporter [Acidihalobacter prosperus]OBS08652.1 hypothetical protein Thpro_022902 [Acidihalobacter prosperus]
MKVDPATSDINCRKLRPNIALTIHTVTLMAYLAASSAPTPLYRIYQLQWQFSAGLLTLIFGIYAFTLLGALLIGGRLSDYLGRKRVIGFALILELVAMGVFLSAENANWLLAARATQGIATGLATASLGAALVDLHHEKGSLTNTLATMAGITVGALGSTALVELAPAPLDWVFVILMAIFVLQLWLNWYTPETSEKRSGVWHSLRPHIAVPDSARSALLAITPINVAVWALGGFYLSLMPTLAAITTHSNSVWLGGLTVATLTLSGGVAIFTVRRRPPFWALDLGGITLVIGLAIVLTGINLGSAAYLLIGSLIAGIGFGAGFFGAVRSIVHLVQPSERAGLMAAFYVESYLANSLPTILAGYMVRHVDLSIVANIYGACIIILAAIGLLFEFFRMYRTKATQRM